MDLCVGTGRAQGGAQLHRLEATTYPGLQHCVVGSLGAVDAWRGCNGTAASRAGAGGVTNNSLCGRTGRSAGRAGEGLPALPWPALPGAMAQQQPASALPPITTRTRPPVSPTLPALHASDYATPSAAPRLAICPPASRPSPPQKRVASRPLVQRKFAHAPVGRALLPLPASTAILARGTWKAKLAGPRSKHTTYPLTPTQHSLVHLLPRPTSTFLLVHAVAGPLPRPLN